MKTQYHEQNMDLDAVSGEQNTLSHDNYYEIGVDEAGRGPLFGRLYVAAVVLPKEGEFCHEKMKDSKKFHSKKKIRSVADYIKANALAWSVDYVDADVIDQINIRQAVFRGMHRAIDQVMHQMAAKQGGTGNLNGPEPFLLIDGNDFQPIVKYNAATEEMTTIKHVTIEGGDNTYTAIAAASILAKVAHDTYIEEMCVTYPALIERYSLDTNVGYGTKKHLDGIREHGITQWHRRTFGQHCRDAKLNTL